MTIKVFVDKRATVRASFMLVDKDTGEEEAHYLDLREELSDFERQTLQLAAVRDTTLNEEGHPVFRADAARQNILRRVAWIAAWSFPQPVSEDSMELLRGPAAAIIDGIVAKHATKAARMGQLLRDPKPAPRLAVVDSVTSESA